MAVRTASPPQPIRRSFERLPQNGRSRAVIDAVRPVIDSGRWPIKRVVGEAVHVEADVFTDGHDHVACELLWKAATDDEWRVEPMRERPNDLWTAIFEPFDLGQWRYKVRAWVDHFDTWRADFQKRVDAGSDVAVDLMIGAAQLQDAAEEAPPAAAEALRTWAARLKGDRDSAIGAALHDEPADLMRRHGPRRFAVESSELRVDVERRKALFSAWYEMFPRSASETPGRHGTLQDVKRRLPYVAQMGFDVLYLPPIHPIGRVARKGRNNQERAADGDVGSPWAIGAREGGHTAIHPDLGTHEDFQELIAAAAELNIEIALDIAFQCAPDHPYVQEHPEWFRRRPDGTIQYAENPPKKYQDIVPFDFECDDWQSLWIELRDVVLHWCEQGVRIFRVDNPHTKPFPFWDWLIASVRERHPDVIFLSEAFTRPKKMNRLAKGGFSQSYTYFTWRYTAPELRNYVEELVKPPVCDLFRPNFWPNTPDILTEQLQHGDRTAAMARLVLAATLSSNYGIYGPVFELCDFTPRGPGVEENLDSEKYQVRHWNLDHPWSLRHFIGLINRIRRENAALQQFRDVQFHHCDNPQHLAYSKRSPSGDNVILCVVNTDAFNEQWGLVRLDLPSMGLNRDAEFNVKDLLTDITYHWRGADNMVGLTAGASHIFRVASPSPLDAKLESRPD